MDKLYELFKNQIPENIKDKQLLGWTSGNLAYYYVEHHSTEKYNKAQ